MKFISNLPARSTVLFLSVLFIFSTQTRPQGHLLKKDQNAIRILTYFSKSNDYSDYGIGADYTYRGIVSLGLLTDKGTYNDGNSTVNIKGIFFSAYPIKTSTNSDISIQCGIGYYDDSFNDEEIDTLYFDFTQSQFEIFAGINYHFVIDDKFLIVPGLIYKHVIFSSDAINFRGRSLKGKSRYSYLILANDFAVLFGRSIILNLSPSLSALVEGDDDSYISFGIDLSLNFIL